MVTLEVRFSHFPRVCWPLFFVFVWLLSVASILRITLRFKHNVSQGFFEPVLLLSMHSGFLIYPMYLVAFKCPCVQCLASKEEQEKNEENEKCACPLGPWGVTSAGGGGAWNSCGYAITVATAPCLRLCDQKHQQQSEYRFLMFGGQGPFCPAWMDSTNCV